MGWANLLGYIFSFFFTQHKVAKGEISTKAFQKDKLNFEQQHNDNTAAVAVEVICNMFANHEYLKTDLTKNVQLETATFQWFVHMIQKYFSEILIVRNPLLCIKFHQN